jgi:phenylpropionate dioxygenase-like ring-hydroxylating dioxygenase large terminal subunit
VRLCTAEAGNARGFSCAYHGWAFGIDGGLASIPLKDDIYGTELDDCQLGLRPVPKVSSYRGFIFACMDDAAPSLEDYLGDAAWYMDLWADVPGGVELLGPPARSVIHANWKSPTENFIGDSYHVGWTHAPALAAAYGAAPPQTAYVGDKLSFQATSRYGHGLGILNGIGPVLLVQTCPELVQWVERRTAELEARKGHNLGRLAGGHWDASIFPNCSYLIGSNAFKVWHPLGPDKVEIMTWAIAEKEMSDDLKRRIKVAVHRIFGTAGMLESDDVDNFEYATRPNQGYVTRQGRLNCRMGMGREREDSVLPGVVGPFMSELAQRGFYRCYADCLGASSWQELEANTANWKQTMLRK